jgi:tetratricopeptide (TPR) repeat protein
MLWLACWFVLFCYVKEVHAMNQGQAQQLLRNKLEDGIGGGGAADLFDALGKEHPETLTSVNNLASVLQNQGKYEEAEPTNRRALEVYEKALGKEHPFTLASVKNLAMVLQDQGKYEVAEPMYRRAVEGKEKALGKEHLFTLTNVSNLASVLQRQGKYEEAETMNRRALEGREKGTVVLFGDFPGVLEAG